VLGAFVVTVVIEVVLVLVVLVAEGSRGAGALEDGVKAGARGAVLVNGEVLRATRLMSLGLFMAVGA
jgi:preprotein translocase subunit SecG